MSGIYRTPDHDLPQWSINNGQTGESLGECLLSPKYDAGRKIFFDEDTPRTSKPMPASPRRVRSPGSPSKSEVEHRVQSRVEEARTCLENAKHHLGNSRNLKTNIKTAVLEAINRLFELVEESERDQGPAAPIALPVPAPTADHSPHPSPIEVLAGQAELLKTLKEHISEIKDNSSKLEQLRDSLASRDSAEGTTYASVAAITNSHTRTQALEQETLHSVVVSSTQEMDTGDDILERIRKAVDAKKGWVRVEKVRKAKDRKIILGCATKEEREKVRERLRAAGENLVIEEVKNKDPLLILRDVLLVHSDEELLAALRNQNREVFHGLGDGESSMTVKYRKNSRNPHVKSVVLAVSPMIWRRALEEGKLRIDLQRVRVEDQTPLVQCTRCLGFGHGKRLCSEPADLCSHCGGPHLRADCPVKRVGTAASCINCTRAKMEVSEHNAFSSECPVRRKWDSFARAAVAYC